MQGRQTHFFINFIKTSMKQQPNYIKANLQIVKFSHNSITVVDYFFLCHQINHKPQILPKSNNVKILHVLIKQ